MTYGEHAKQCRREAGLTVKRLSQITGIAEGTIRTFESGYRVTNINNVIAIADALRLSIDELIGREVKGD